MDGGLKQTAGLWPEVKAGFELVHGAAQILKNEQKRDGQTVRRQYRKHLQTMRRKAPKTGALRQAIDQFIKVSGSYFPGLFFCYDVRDLPRTNNDLEQFFGSTRCHERRCTGRKVASPSLVLRGPVRVLAALGTREQTYSGQDLAPMNLVTWRGMREDLERRRQSRVLRCRFRRDPAAYLSQLEEILLRQPLPP